MIFLGLRIFPGLSFFLGLRIFPGLRNFLGLRIFLSQERICDFSGT